MYLLRVRDDFLKAHDITILDLCLVQCTLRFHWLNHGMLDLLMNELTMQNYELDIPTS